MMTYTEYFMHEGTYGNYWLGFAVQGY